MRVIHPLKKIEIKISEESINLILLDSTFKSVVSNLLNNALDSLADEMGHVLIELFKEDSKIVMEIKDNGKGIPHHILAQLGSVPITFGKGSSGNGLGFYNSKKWALTKKGNLTINSQLGIGSLIHLELPLEQSLQ